MVIEGPLAPWDAAMAKRLREFGYAPDTATNHLRLVAKLSAFLERRGLDASDVSPVVLARFCSSVRHNGRSPSPKMLGWLVEFLRDVGVEPRPVPTGPRSKADELLDRYSEFMVEERGVAAETVTNYVRALKPFLAEFSHLPLADLTAGDVSGYMARECRCSSARGLERLATSLRSFLRFALVDGLIVTPLSNAVPSAARWSVAGLPQGLGPGEVKALLRSCDRRTAVGRRDYAILVAGPARFASR